jgi:Helix-turn-helix domain
MQLNATARIQLDVITVETAAELLDRRPSTIVRWARAGKFPPAVKVAGKWLVLWPVFERWQVGETPIDSDWLRGLRALTASGVRRRVAADAITKSLSSPPVATAGPSPGFRPNQGEHTYGYPTTAA